MNGESFPTSPSRHPDFVGIVWTPLLSASGVQVHLRRQEGELNLINSLVYEY